MYPKVVAICNSFSKQSSPKVCPSHIKLPSTDSIFKEDNVKDKGECKQNN